MALSDHSAFSLFHILKITNAWKVIQLSSRNRYWHSSKLPKATWFFPALRVGIEMPLFRRFLAKRA